MPRVKQQLTEDASNKNRSSRSPSKPRSFYASVDGFRSLQQMSMRERINIVEQGISKTQLTNIKILLKMDFDTLSDLLMVTDRTLHLKKGNSTFSPIISDRIMMLIELYSYGFDVLGRPEDFIEWMKRPNEQLLRRTPLEVIRTHPGLLQVRELLRKLRYGLY